MTEPPPSASERPASTISATSPVSTDGTTPSDNATSSDSATWNDNATSTAMSARPTEPSSRLRDTLAWTWLAFSATWAVVILVTDHVDWPLALWIAATVGPLAALELGARDDHDRRPDTTPHASESDADHPGESAG